MKLVVSDFDLTFFDSNYDENIALINSFVEKGNIFVIATGRSFELLQKDILNKNINFEYLICSDGSVILDKKYNVLKKVVVDFNTINEIIEKIQKDNNLKFLNIDKIKDEMIAVYAVFNSMEYSQKILKDILYKYDVKGYLSTHGIKIINKNVSKVIGIEYIKKILNIEDTNIYVVGDQVNDLEMINKYKGYLIGKNISNFKEFMKKIDN